MKISKKALIAASLVLMLTPLLVSSVALAKPNGDDDRPRGQDNDDNGGGHGKPSKTPLAWGNLVTKPTNVTIRIVNGTAFNATNRDLKYRFNATITARIEKNSTGRWKAGVITKVTGANLTIQRPEGGVATYEFLRGLVIIPLRSGKIHVWVTLNNTATGEAAKLVLHGKLGGAIPSPPGTITVDFLAPQSKLVRGINQPAFFLSAVDEPGKVLSRLSVEVLP